MMSRDARVSSRYHKSGAPREAPNGRPCRSPHSTTLQTAESRSAAIKIRPTRGRCTSLEARVGGAVATACAAVLRLALSSFSLPPYGARSSPLALSSRILFPPRLAIPSAYIPLSPLRVFRTRMYVRMYTYEIYGMFRNFSIRLRTRLRGRR